MSNETTLPQTVADLTPEFLSEAVSSRYPGAVAEHVEVVDQHSGTTGRARLRVRWKHRAGAPEAIFVKLAPTDPLQRAMVVATGMGKREARFHAELAGRLPIRSPGPLWADWSEAGDAYVMLMEDLAAAGCTFPTPSDDDDGEHARGMLETLARLHAHFWESPRFADDLGWIEPPMRHEVGPQLVKMGVESFGDEMPDSFHELADLYLGHTEALCDAFDAGPQTLLHGDSHVINTFFEPSSGDAVGRAVGLLDWACTCRGPGLRDVSYYLCNSISTESRRTHQHDLLNHYIASLVDAGGPRLDFDAAWEQYACLAACGWIAATATAGAGERMQPLALSRAAIDRSNHAIAELETAKRLGRRLGL